MNNSILQGTKATVFPFSKQAFADGYDFSVLSPEEQELTKHYYTNYKDMLETYYKYKSANYYLEMGKYHYDIRGLYDIGWSFYGTGIYDGIIVGCSPSLKRNSCEYILDILIEENCIRHIKFIPFNESVITTAIYEEFGDISTDDLIGLVGKWVQINVNNNFYGHKRISYINELEFYSNEAMDIYKKMFDCMFGFDFAKNCYAPKNKCILSFRKNRKERLIYGKYSKKEKF